MCHHLTRCPPVLLSSLVFCLLKLLVALLQSVCQCPMVTKTTNNPCIDMQYDDKKMVALVSRLSENKKMVINAFSLQLTFSLQTYWAFKELSVHGLPSSLLISVTLAKRAWCELTSVERQTSKMVITFLPRVLQPRLEKW